jgi:heptaprenyl diphosphate synthase
MQLRIVVMTNILLDQRIPEKVDINSAHKHCAELVHDLFSKAPSAIRPITTHILSAPGKGVRTTLLFLSAMDADGLVPKEVIQAATAVEILHLATLVHDDVIDEAETRRGIQSIHSKFSKKEAILCGDYLFCLAFATISGIYEHYVKFTSKFTGAISKICLGELKQYSNNYNSKLSFFEYIKIIHGKTAALFHISAYGGALIGGMPENEIKALGKFGTYFGMIFQIVDDCKDYTLSESEALKPTKSDIASGIVNLPLLMTFIKEPLLRRTPFTAELINDVQRLGGVADAFGIAEKYEKKARSVLNTLENKGKATALKNLMEQVLVYGR